MKKAWLVMLVAVCFCCTLAAGTSQAREVKLSLTSSSFGGSSVATNALIINAAVSLVLDDGSRDNDIGLGGTSAFMFLNRFTPASGEYPFSLTEVQVYFSTTGLVNNGDNITLVVYENTSGNTDPAVGSNWLASFSATVQTLDAWNVYSLPSPVTLNGPGDVIIGVIALETPGTNYWPASIDQTATRARSWIGWWNASPPPSPATLPPDNTWNLIDTFFPGNWMIRGYGLAACIDKDGDTYGDNCSAGPDCNDNNSAVNPGVAEVCGNGIDDDCDNQTDEGCAPSTTTTTTPASECIDDDSDGYLAGDNCTPEDCNDTDAFYTDICPDCTVRVIPRTLGWLTGDKEKTRSLFVIGKRGTEFDENPVIKWESDAIEVVRTRVLFKRFMFMRAKFNGAPLEKEDYRVLIGDCEGSIKWAR
ncbi:MAG: putative metal-binding motif-containing protein [Deltaproteobacteria bacterium]|nr:putative metal-binding motif-containing protein [Deltaproteobacteria bacterium]